MIRPTTARIDLQALESNYRTIVEFVSRERATAPPGVIAVVKANAYGHGALAVTRRLEQLSVDAVATAISGGKSSTTAMA